jgi:hypothetical protein
MGCFCSKKREVPREVSWKGYLGRVREPLTDMVGLMMILRDKGNEPHLVEKLQESLEKSVLAVNELGANMERYVAEYYEEPPKKDSCPCLTLS